MNIGQASETSGVSAKMIRYYESIGLIAPPLRSESGYRLYSDKEVHALRFINRARDLGFSIEQIKDLLSLWRDRSRASADVKAIALEHFAELETKAQAIRDMSETLRHLAESCNGDDRPDCPIIEGFANATPAEKRKRRKPRFGLTGTPPQPTYSRCTREFAR